MNLKFEASTLAVHLRCAPRSGNHCHFSCRDLIETIGGSVAILYGIFIATPPRHHRQKYYRAIRLASALDAYALKRNAE